MLGRVAEPADRRLLVTWCAAVPLLTVGIVAVTTWTASLSRSMGLELTRWQGYLADGPTLLLLAGVALTATGVGAARLGALGSLRWGLAAILLGGGALFFEAAVWPEVAVTPTRPPGPDELGRCGNALAAETWSFWLAWLLAPPAVVALLLAGVAWARDVGQLGAAPRDTAGEVAVVAFVSGPLVVAALPFTGSLTSAPATSAPLLVDPTTALATTLLLLIPLGVAAARGLLLRATGSGEATASP